MYRFRQFLLLGGEIIGFFLALVLSLGLRSQEIPNLEKIYLHLPLFSVIFLIWILVNYINGLYNLSLIQDRKMFKRMFEALGVSFAVSIAFLYALPKSNIITPKTILILNITIGYSISYIWRIIFKKINGFKQLHTKILFLGHTKEVEEIINITKKEPAKGYKISAIIDPNHKLKQSESKCDLYKNLTVLRPSITKYQPQIVVVSPHMQENTEALRELYQLLFWPVSIVDLTSFYETLTGRIPPSAFSESWFLKNLNNKEHIVYQKIINLINFIACIILSLIFILLLPIIIILIKLTSKGPVFYKQNRVGQYGEIFKIYKFRTMEALSADGGAETSGVQFAKKNDKRITKVGNFLRKTRLDELPQVINLLKGDLTLIGPRPERPEIVEKLEERMSYYPLRHTTKPGITGWAAINQHYTADLETSLQKLQYDLYYIKNRSILLDLSIILKTINVVLRGMGQ